MGQYSIFALFSFIKNIGFFGTVQRKIGCFGTVQHFGGLHVALGLVGGAAIKRFSRELIDEGGPPLCEVRGPGMKGAGR